MFRSLISLFRATPPAFTPYEAAILDAIMAELDEPRRARFAARLAALTHIRRTDGGRHVDVAQQARGRRLLPEATRLTALDGDRLLARFTVSSRRTLSALQGRAWLSDGNFSRLTFTQPTEHAQCDDVHRISVKIDDQIDATDGRQSPNA